MPKNTPTGTIYRRAIRRTDRRARALIAEGVLESREHGHPLWSHAVANGPCRLTSRTTAMTALLVESARLSNALAECAFGTGERAAASLLHTRITS